jgi:hypothetical protein
VLFLILKNGGFFYFFNDKLPVPCKAMFTIWKFQNRAGGTGTIDLPSLYFSTSRLDPDLTVASIRLPDIQPNQYPVLNYASMSQT